MSREWRKLWVELETRDGSGAWFRRGFFFALGVMIAWAVAGLPAMLFWLL